MVLKKDALSQPQETGKNALDGLIVAVVVLVGFVTILVLIRKRRKNQ
jgi:cobaltochelatase CobN